MALMSWQDCEHMPEENWARRFAGRCYFYPARDCPGWMPGGVCGRIGDRIPLEADSDDPEDDPEDS